MDHISPGLLAIIENFHLCSHLPLTAFKAELETLLLTGHTEQSSMIFRHYFTKQTITEKLPELNHQLYQHYSLPNGVSLSLFHMKHLAKSIYLVIGPYTTNHLHKEILPYKPYFSMDALMHLLTKLYHEHLCVTEKATDLTQCLATTPLMNQTHYSNAAYYKLRPTHNTYVAHQINPDADNLTSAHQVNQHANCLTSAHMANGAADCLDSAHTANEDANCLASVNITTLSETDETHEQSYHVTKAKRYIEAHYKEPITLDVLSDYLGINKSYFCTIFKKVTKHSYCTYLNHIRIEKSKWLLCHTSYSILEISLEIGYNSASYYNNMFKKLVGQTPLAYRTAYLNRHT